MKTIHVDAAMNQKRRKGKSNRAYEVIFHALIISFLALAGCQTVATAAKAVPLSWYERAALAVISFVTPSSEEGSGE